MAPSTIHLPNGQSLSVTPVFGGLSFKSLELNNHHSPFPPGWTIVLNSEAEGDIDEQEQGEVVKGEDATDGDDRVVKRRTISRYRKPTLQNDHLYISSISNPNSNEFRPASSPTRQIAMMLWATLWWYFHQEEPDRRMKTKASAQTTEDGRPRGDWKIRINREGIFKGKVVLPKLERMGLIASEDSSVGIYQDDRTGDGWHDMFVSRRSFWQLDPRIYLFTLTPLANSPYPAGTPRSSRPSSPSGLGPGRTEHSPDPSLGLWSPTAPGPFHSTSHLPTYYPPPPTQYVFTNRIRHPIRPKPPRQGEVLYTRYIPSVSQYLSFRVASLSPRSVVYRSPAATATSSSVVDNTPPSTHPCDLDILHKWMNDPRVAHSWGEAGPKTKQESFLLTNLRSRHSFPVIGCWDGKPFGYFEIYWVKEDNLGPLLGNAGDYDRGIHCLVGEQEFRGQHRVKIWLSALVHYCWLADSRTETVVMEPRVDNVKLREYTEAVGFFKEREVAFPHKQSNLMKIRREAWDAPAI